MKHAARPWTLTDSVGLILNIFLAALFLTYSAHLWHEPGVSPEEESVGGALAYGLMVLCGAPIILVLNVIWLGVRLRRHAAALASVALIAVVLLGWFVLVRFSGSRI